MMAARASSSSPPPDPDEVIEGLKLVAGWLDEFWHLRVGTVSTFAVFRAAHRRRDPLPTFRVLGKRVARVVLLRAWASRQNPAQLALMFVAAPGGEKPQ